MESVSYKIKIRASVNGVEKVPSSIAWITGNDECLLRPCYKENDYLIVELIPGCVGSACIEGYLMFDDTCSNCEPIHFKRCFCSENSDCEDCQECNQGICQDKCLADEYCLNNTCVECDPNTPCPDGKVCINGRCVCPQGFFEKNGQCIQCDSTTILTKCQECRNGLIVEKPCDGACDPTTGNCVDCLTGGDCSSRTDGKTCCDNKQCVCCAGTVWSPELNMCIPQPCANDKECGDPCLKCTPEGCKPITCPAGYKCYKGECVYWPCISTSCDNGADCGPECGCVEFEGVKQCVPCHILECEGLCELALGCRCNGTKCEALPDCSQYCDGETSCSDPSCTCYNNNCVNCANFPCDPNDCSNRINCGCDNGDCNGGKGCKDTLEIIKACGNNTTDCKLTGKLTLDKQCNCDDIKFVTSNFDTSSLASCSNTNNKDIKLKVNLFKGNVNYSDFNNLSIGDNEFVEGIISTRVSHYNNLGALLNVTVTPITDKSIINNQVQEIILTKDTHFKVHNNNVDTQEGYRVIIEVIAKNIKVPNNGCIKYTNEVVIAEYNLDFTSSGSLIQFQPNTIGQSLFCSTIKTAIISETKYLNDKISLKNPLFIWSKSPSDFPTTEYQNTGNYENKGWFRKVYGVKTSTGWEDVLNTVESGLVNNYNYTLRVDCGCSKLAVYNRLDFCCLPEITPNLTSCNTKLVFPSFKTCAINGRITSTTIPEFNKAFYKLKITHEYDVVYKDISFNVDNVNTLAVNYEDATKGQIIKLELIRYFKGGLLADSLCEKNITLPLANTPDVVYTTECKVDEFNYNVILNQTTSGLKILTATFIKSSVDQNIIVNGTPYVQNIVMGSSLQKSIVIPIKKQDGSGFINFGTESLFMVVNFEGGCTKVFKLTPCEKEIDLTVEPSAFSGKQCPSPTAGPTIFVTTIGFSSNVEFSLNNGAYQTSNSFSNVDPGIYNVKAKDIINGVETILESTIEVLPKQEVAVTLTPSTICIGQNAALTIIGDPGQSFTIKAPNGSVITSSAILNSGGSFTLPNVTTAGEYTITNNAVNNKYCDTDKRVTLEVGGQVLTPQINSGTSTCLNTPIEFTITDNIGGKEYNVNGIGGFITNGAGDNVSLATSGLSYFYTPTTIGGNTIQITGINNLCDTLSSPVNKVITVTTSPIITNITNTCVNGITTVSANVTIGAGTITGVTIGGVTATNTGSTYSVSGLTQSSTVDIIATASNGCTNTATTTVANCNCLSATLTISGPASPLCDQQLITITAASQLNPNISTGAWTYQWYEQAPINCNNCTDIPVGASGSWGVQPVTLQVNAIDFGGYYLVVTNNLNPECTYTSNVYNYTVQAPPAIPTIDYTLPLEVGTAITFNTVQSYTNYRWYVNGSPTPTSTTSTLIFTPTTPGPLTVMVSVDNGDITCARTATVNLNVDMSCNQLGTIVPVPGTSSCAEFQQFSIGYNSIGVFNWEITQVNGSGTGNILIGQTGTSSGLSFNVDISQLPSSAAITTIKFVMTYTMTGGSSCTQEAVVNWSYSRCNCVCSTANSCTDIFTRTGNGGYGTYSVGYFPAGKTLNFRLGHQNVADKFVVDYAGNTIVDTTYLGNQLGTANCPIVQGLDYYITDPGDDGSNIKADIISAGGTVDATILAVMQEALAVTFTYTTLVEGELVISHNTPQCANQGDWLYRVECP